MTKTDPVSLANWESQIRKGMLDFLILLFLKQKEYYGYDLIKTIKQTARLDISEGTIYPLLNRLKSQKLITSRWEEKEVGLPRKYYQITASGLDVLEAMKSSWNEFRRVLDELMKESS